MHAEHYERLPWNNYLLPRVLIKNLVQDLKKPRWKFFPPRLFNYFQVIIKSSFDVVGKLILSLRNYAIRHF